VRLTAVSDPGWRFSHWSGDATGTTNPVFVRINGDTTVTANYTRNQYQVFLPLIAAYENVNTPAAGRAGIYTTVPGMEKEAAGVFPPRRLTRKR
jgi:hypothetical protein